MLDELLERARGLNRERRYPDLVALLESRPREDLFDEPELGLLYADVLRRVGRSVDTVVVCAELMPFSRRRGNDRLSRGRLNILGMAQFDQGQVNEAESTWQELYHDARGASDEEFSAKAIHNIGVVLTLTDRMEEALSAYSRALAAYQRLGHRRGLAQTHHNLGISYRELGFLPESDDNFRRALDFARADESEDEIARIEQERALTYLLAGDAKMARHSADSALASYVRLEDPAGQGESWRTVGLIDLALGNLGESLRSMELALDLARSSRAALLEAEIHVALSCLHLARGHDAEADRSSAEAREGFKSLGAEAWGAKSFRLVERLRSMHDDPADHETKKEK